jgi:hypothetical protein
MPMLVGKRVWAALSDVRAPADMSSRVCAARGRCARFGSHLLSPHVTSGGPPAGGVLMVKPMGAICR